MKPITKVPDVLNKKTGKTIGGEGPGDRSIPGEAPTNKHDKNPGLQPINSRKVSSEKGVGGGTASGAGGGRVMGCGKGK